MLAHRSVQTLSCSLFLTPTVCGKFRNTLRLAVHLFGLEKFVALFPESQLQPFWWLDMRNLKLVKRLRLFRPTDCCGKTSVGRHVKTRLIPPDNTGIYCYMRETGFALITGKTYINLYCVRIKLQSFSAFSSLVLRPESTLNAF